MSAVDLARVAELLEAVESDDRSRREAEWLLDGGEFPAGLSADEALVAIEAARRMALMNHLQLAKQSNDKVVKKAASKAIHVLKTQGHEVPAEPKTGSWTLGSEERTIPEPVGLLGLPQGDGYFPFILVSHNRSGAYVTAGVAGSGQGFQDADHVQVGRSKARQITENARQDHNLVEVPVHIAIHFCERAFDEGGGERPGGWSQMLSSIAEGTKNTARLVDPLARQADTLDASMLGKVDALLEGPHRVVFNLEERISGPAVDSVMEALGSQLSIDDDDKKRRVAAEVIRAVDEAFEGHARKTWILALDVVASIADVADWREVRDAARHTSLALQAGRKGSDIPFFRIWTERQLAAVSEMILAVRAGKEMPLQ